MNKDSKIYIAGHNGLVGSAIVRKLKSEGYNNLVIKTHKELDLTSQSLVSEFFKKEKPEYVFLAAAKVGGIEANYLAPADFFYQNMMIENNIIHSAYINNVTKLLFLGSTCIYPKESSQPIKEEYLLSGYLESTNEAYAIAKIAGLKMCQYYKQQYDCNFISCMPTNLYGPNDNFDLNTSHVLPALIRKFIDAKKKAKPIVEIWGSGKPLREFLYVDDMADACFFLMNNYDGVSHINIGTGKDISIGDLAIMIKEIINYEGKLKYDQSMPDGTFRKLVDITKLTNLGWKNKISLREGIISTIEWYKKNAKNILGRGNSK